MTELPVQLTALSEDQRAQAHTRFTIIRPALEDGVIQAQVARTHNIPASTVKRYREKGLAGLADAAGRSDKGKSSRLPPDAITLIEGLALQRPPCSATAIHRQVTGIAKEQGWKPPSHARVRQIIKNLDPTDPAWLSYQLALQAILQFTHTTLGYAEVEDSRDYPGLLSEVPRQIDATISLPDKRRIAVECKQWNREVDIQQVEAFDAKVRNDLGWDVGTPIMVVTAVDFTPAAKNYAGKRNIQLAKLNHAATAETYTLQLEGHTLIGSMDQLYAESSGTFMQTPVEP